VSRVVTWNGRPLAVRPTSSGSLHVVRKLAGPRQIALPDLTAWKFSAESPEAAAGFDDSAWRAADLTAKNSTTKPPAGEPVLTADDYGFHHGDVRYRGRTGSLPDSVSFDYGGGGAGMLQAWVDGVYLGQNVLSTGVASPPTRGTATFAVPAELRGAGDHVLSVMVRNNSHNEDGGVNDAHKEGRGLIGTSLTGVSWRVQGGAATDPVRGPLNNGGLHGERAGWFRPGFNDRSWAARTVPDTTAVAGTSWYRTSFDLRIPAGTDASIGLTIGDPSVPRSGGHYRVLVFPERLEHGAVPRRRRAAAHVRAAQRGARPARPQHAGAGRDQ
jgi:beta-galactosidase GanA